MESSPFTVWLLAVSAKANQKALQRKGLRFRSAAKTLNFHFHVPQNRKTFIQGTYA